MRLWIHTDKYALLCSGSGMAIFAMVNEFRCAKVQLYARMCVWDMMIENVCVLNDH